MERENIYVHVLMEKGSSSYQGSGPYDKVQATVILYS